MYRSVNDPKRKSSTDLSGSHTDLSGSKENSSSEPKIIPNPIPKMQRLVYICLKCSRQIEIEVDPETVTPIGVQGDTLAPECEKCKVKMLRSWDSAPVRFRDQKSAQKGVSKKK